jgi:hypothetical protein
MLFLSKSVQAEGERINSFLVNILIKNDASMVVAEDIEYDFGATQKHGIYRNIPIKYQARGGNYNLRISDIAVTDENDIAYKFQAERSGNDMVIKIGDSNTYVTGKKIYKIAYRINRAINYFDEYDELYWNVTGNGWQVPIDKAAAVVRFENKEFDMGQLKADCFYGGYASTTRCDFVAENGKISFSWENLNAGEGMTIVAGFPKGVVFQLPWWQEIWNVLKDNYILFLPLLTFCAMIYFWYSRGRDPQGQGTIIAQYDVPDRLTPAEIGVVFDTGVDNRDISAEIIWMAIKGYLKITRKVDKILFIENEEYILEQLKTPDEQLNVYQKKLLKDIFSYGTSFNQADESYSGSSSSRVLASVKMSDLKNKFYKDLQVIEALVCDAVTLKGYFEGNPKKAKVVYWTIGFVMILVGGWISDWFGYLYFIALGLSGLIIIIFALIMAKRSLKGVSAKEHILGLKEYLDVAEKDRIEFHNAPEKSPEVFEKFLPYAMVLGVEKAWAKQFEGIYNQPAAWYSDSTMSSFSAIHFVNGISHFSSSAYSSMGAKPSQASGGGSGFSGGGSGGGFGGGGGGSW